MAKRFKDFRESDEHFNEWEDIRNEDRQKEKLKGKRRKNNRLIKEKMKNSDHI
jgi:hypothetical protein